MKTLKFLVINLFLLTGFQAQAITITQQGSGELSYLTNGNACWRACYMAVNQAKERIEAVATNHCSGGYTITSYPTCSWPASDPSFLDMDGAWPVCKCSDTCTGSFTCNNSGQFPSVFGNVAEQWRKVRVFTMQHKQEVNDSYTQMQGIRNPGALLQAVESNAIEYGYNLKEFYKKLEKGWLENVQAPSHQQLLKEFNIPIRYGVKPIKKPGQPLPIKPIQPTPIQPKSIKKSPILPVKPGHPKLSPPKVPIKDPECIKAECLGLNRIN